MSTELAVQSAAIHEAAGRSLRRAPLPEMPVEVILPEARAGDVSGPRSLNEGFAPASFAFPIVPEKIPVLRRVLEVTVASIALVLTSPIMLAIALIIRLGTPGPVLFWQPRMGLNAKPFMFCKFRTLYADARERFPELYDYRFDEHHLRNRTFKEEIDPRVTPQGRWLRKTTLDELPNLIHVITGRMALVGPRPDVPEMLPFYQGEMLERFTVRPGLTGLVQVSGRARLSFYETSQLDIEYVRRRSFRLDLKVLARTIWSCVLREGAF